jgi:hypothetical protein
MFRRNMLPPYSGSKANRERQQKEGAGQLYHVSSGSCMSRRPVELSPTNREDLKFKAFGL